MRLSSKHPLSSSDFAPRIDRSACGLSCAQIKLFGVDDVELLRQLQCEFVRERDWGQFHTPKNIAMALGGEVGELAEAISHLKYRNFQNSYDTGTEVSDEIGDVTLYLLRLHDLLDVPVVIAPDEEVESPQNPKPAMLINAVFRLMASVGRILESYQWMAADERLSAEAHRQAVNRLEVATRDLASVSNLLAINPITAASAKLEKNRKKYPVHTSRGTSRKHTEIGGQ